MSKQTAVEWLVEQIKFNLIAKPLWENGEVKEFYLPKGERLDELAKQAKEILLYSKSIQSLNCTPPVKEPVSAVPKPKKSKIIQMGNPDLLEFT
jgi:hypothetical protein